MRIKKFDSMNVIPFIDIMLVLLAIVLIFSTFIAQGRLEIKLPKSNTTEQIDVKLKEIKIDVNGEIYYENEQIDIKKLKEILAQLPKETNISLRADENSAFRIFVQVIDIFKELNLKKISIITELNR